MFKLLDGSQTLGRGWTFWSCFLAVLAAALIYPVFADSYDVGNFSYFLIWIFMALGLCLMWGYGGMLSFGQTLFFGIAGYAYGVLAINMGGGSATIAALVLSIVIAMIAAGILGYFMIWGGINGIFFGIVTLSATLVLAFFLGQTAGPEWRIGPARLNGYNGMKGMDPLAVGDYFIEGSALYYVMVALIVIVYLALRMLVNSRFGNVIVAIARIHSAPKCSATTSASINSSPSSSAAGSRVSAARFTRPGANSSRRRASACRRRQCRSCGWRSPAEAT